MQHTTEQAVIEERPNLGGSFVLIHRDQLAAWAFNVRWAASTILDTHTGLSAELCEWVREMDATLTPRPAPVTL